MTDEGFEVVECRDKAEWLKVRKRGIGASEAATLVGADPYGNTLADLWAKKCGILSDTIQETERMRLGTRLEPVLRELYMEATDRLVVWSPYTIHRLPTSPWALATLDGEIAPLTEDGGPGVLELKCVDAALAGEWKDEPPLAHLVQVQWQLLVTGYQWGSIACLLGGNKFLWLDIERREDVIGVLVAEGEKLWRMVETREPPPIEHGSASAANLLAALYAKDDGTTIELPAEALDWDARRTELKLQEWRIKEDLHELDNRIKASIGLATIGNLPDGSGRFQWKQVVRHMPAREAYDSKFRELRRLKAPKGKSNAGAD